MSKKIVLFVILFFAVAGVILVGIFGTQASGSGNVLATELYFDVPAGADGKKMMSSPEIGEEGFVTVLLSDMITLSGGRDLRQGKPFLQYVRARLRQRVCHPVLKRLADLLQVGERDYYRQDDGRLQPFGQAVLLQRHGRRQAFGRRRSRIRLNTRAA